jgi:hypothetical protein
MLAGISGAELPCCAHGIAAPLHTSSAFLRLLPSMLLMTLC